MIIIMIGFSNSFFLLILLQQSKNKAYLPVQSLYFPVYKTQSLIF